MQVYFMSYQEGLNLNPTITSTKDESIATADLVDTLESLGNHIKLVAAVKAVGLEGRLRGPDLITFFAPDDKAFSHALGSENCRSQIESSAFQPNRKFRF